MSRWDRTVRQRLSDHMSPIEAEAWLNRPHAALEGRTPLSVIQSSWAETVHQLIDRMDAGEIV